MHICVSMIREWHSNAFITVNTQQDVYASSFLAKQGQMLVCMCEPCNNVCPCRDRASNYLITCKSTPRAAI